MIRAIHRPADRMLGAIKEYAPALRNIMEIRTRDVARNASSTRTVPETEPASAINVATRAPARAVTTPLAT